MTAAEPSRRDQVADLRTRIDRRHMRPDDGFRGGVVLHEVPSVEGRRADALAVDFRNASPGLIGYEIKVARGDWLAELDQPEKAAAWAQHCTEWYVIAPDGVVNREELPDGWGLITPVAKVRSTVRVTARRRDPAPLPLPVVIELAKKLDTLRVHEVASATEKLQRKVRDLESEKNRRGYAEERYAEDARLLRGLLERIGVDRAHASTWRLSQPGSPEEQTLEAALKGTSALIDLRDRAQRDLANIRRTVADLVARIDDRPADDPFEEVS
jgi:hypothetical protein